MLASPRARVLIADDHHAFAEKCRRMLEAEFEVVGIATNRSDLVKFVAKLKPDIAVIDLGRPEMSGFEAGEGVKAIRSATKIIYMTVVPDFGSVTEAFQRGAAGFVDKMRCPEDLRVAVRWAIRGDLWLSGSVLAEKTRAGNFV